MLDLSKGSNAFILMQDFFKYMKNYTDMSIDDTDKWEKIINEGNMFVDKFSGNQQTKRLALELVNGYIAFWESECRNEQV